MKSLLDRFLSTGLNCEELEDLYMYLLLTSSTTSRIAACFESSPGSTPPEGTTHLPGCRQLETNSTYEEQTQTGHLDR